MAYKIRMNDDDLLNSALGQIPIPELIWLTNKLTPAAKVLIAHLIDQAAHNPTGTFEYIQFQEDRKVTRTEARNAEQELINLNLLEIFSVRTKERKVKVYELQFHNLMKLVNESDEILTGLKKTGSGAVLIRK